MVHNLTKEEAKEAFKEAIKEWMDEQFLTFGRWTVHALTAAGVAAMTYFILKMNGWVKT